MYVDIFVRYQSYYDQELDAIQRRKRTGGVVSNLVIFHSSEVPVTFLAISARGPEVTAAGSKTSSETAGMLLRLVVSPREMKLIEKVAFSSGSSQHGNARRADVGCKVRGDKLTDVKWGKSAHFESQC